MLDKLIFLVALAGTAVVFADVLVREGMLLASVQRWCWLKWAERNTRYISEPQKNGFDVTIDTSNADLGTQWWWKPLWGCYLCVSGQWGFWGYLIRYHEGYTWRSIPEHLAFAAFTIIAAIIISKWTRDN